MWTKIIKSGYSNYRSVLSLIGVGLVKFKTNKPILDLESAGVGEQPSNHPVALILVKKIIYFQFIFQF